MSCLLSEKLKNIPLANKLQIMMLPGIFLLSFFLFIGYLLIIRSSNALLYQTSGELLSYSSKDISRNLNSIQNMANFMLEDSDIQRALSESKDAEEGTIPPNVYSTLHSAVNTYYQRYKANYVDYVQIINDDFSVLASGIDSHILPQQLQDELVKKAREQDGRLLWITDYCDTYGVFLVRSFRRIEYMALDELGILIINVNLTKLLEEISYMNTSGSVSYALYDEDRALYLPNHLLHPEQEELSDIPSNQYKIQKLCGQQYFAIRGTISTTGWDYFCLAPYNNMYNNVLFVQRLFLIVLLVSLCLCITLTQTLMKPLMVHFDTLIQKITAFGNEKFEIIEIPYPYHQRYDEIGLIHQQFDSMAKKIQTLIRENYETQLLAKESQLKALEMQINPHFLYNTLQTINWRAKMLRDTQISLMTESLGKLLRITLSKETANSSLKQELELVQYYINIQKTRFEETLSYETDVSEDLLSTYLPKFTLQPLVENAIRYTLEEDSDACMIQIRAYREDSNIVISVANTGSVFEEDLLEKLNTRQIVSHGFGIGVLNVNKRLELAFEKKYHLLFLNQEKFAVAKLVILADTQKKKENTNHDSTVNC